MKSITIPLYFLMSSAAYSNQISININTILPPSDIYVAKIRLKQSNEWIVLGEISSGNNKFHLDTSIDSNVGSLWIEKSSSEKWVAHFDKSEDTKSLNFFIENEQLLSKTALKKDIDKENEPQRIKVTNDDSVSNDRSSSKLVNLYKLSPNAKNAWPANCNYFDWIFSTDAFCAVAANPGFNFQSINTTGGSVIPEFGSFGGNYESTRSASDIKTSGEASFDLVGYGVYARGHFYWGNGKYDVFNGGGVGVGAVKGKGRFL